MQIFLKRPLSMIVGVQGFKGFVNNPCFTVQLIKVKMIFVDYWQTLLFLQLLKDKEELQKQLADAVVKTEALEQEKQKQEEDARLLNRQLSETHENEVLLLKEELQTKNTEVVTAKTSEEQLKAKIAQLVQEKQNLATECEMQKTELARRWVLDMNIHATDNWGLNCFLLATMEVKSIGTFSSGISKTSDRSPSTPNKVEFWVPWVEMSAFLATTLIGEWGDDGIAGTCSQEEWLAQLVGTQPSVREVSSSTPRCDFLFDFFPFCVTLFSSKFP